MKISKKIVGRIQYGVAIIFGICLLPFIYHVVKDIDSMYMPTFNNPNRYHYLFKESIRKDLKNIYTAGRAQKGWQYSYVYKDEIRFIVWEIFNAENVSITEISPYKGNIRIEPWKYSSLSEIGPEPSITVENKTPFELPNKMKIYYTGEHFSVDSLEEKKGIYFKGNINQISFVNMNNERQIRYCMNNKNVLTDLLVYRTDSSLMMIVANPLINGSMHFIDKEYLTIN